LRVRVRLPPAQRPRELHDRFPRFAPARCPRTHPKVSPGRSSWDDGSSRSLVRSPRRADARRTYRPLPTNAGLAGERPARPLRSFTPPGSPFCDDPDAWPGRDRPSVLSWDFPPSRALSTTVPGPVSREETHAGLEVPCHVPPRAPSHRGCIPRSGLRRLGSRAQDPSIRMVYRTRVSLSGGDPAHATPLERPRAPVASPILAPRGVRTERLARAPFRRHPAPPCPWRPLPPKGPETAGPRRRWS